MFKKVTYIILVPYQFLDDTIELFFLFNSIGQYWFWPTNWIMHAHFTYFNIFVNFGIM